MAMARPLNWGAPNWRPANWEMPTHSAPPVVVYTRSAFLDRFGRFAKRDEDVAEIRMWPEDAVLGDAYLSLTIAQFKALPVAERTAIKEMGSAAGLIVTEGISNA